MMMMSSDQNPTVSKPPNEERSQRTASSRPQEPALRCPRCDSPNTKFCYYNNYSLSQPRHFCKSCRRYWTRGGALRNVPLGGGCRKNKRIVKSSPSSSSSSLSSPIFSTLSDSCKDSSNIGGGFKFFHGLMSPDFGGLSLNRMISPSPSELIYNNTPASSLVSSSGFRGSLIPDNINMGSVNTNSYIASSIESLSTLNQDLHWKLQQQRLAMLYGNIHENPKEINMTKSTEITISSTPSVIAKPQPILFHNLEISSKPEDINDYSRKEGVGGANGESAATEWFFGNSALSSFVCSTTDMAAASTGGGNNDNGDANMGNWHGVQAWGDLHHHYNNALP